MIEGKHSYTLIAASSSRSLCSCAEDKFDNSGKVAGTGGRGIWNF